MNHTDGRDDAVPAFSAMLRTALRGRVRDDATSFLQMFAPDGVMEFPYGLPGFDTVHGRDVLARRLSAQGGTLEFVGMSNPLSLLGVLEGEAWLQSLPTSL